MKIVSNEFLLDIARDYSKDIMAVLIYEAPVEKKIKAAVFKDKTSFVIIDIDPEAEDYSDIPPYVDTKSQYRIGQKGAIIWVTRRHVIDDRIDLIRGMTRRMARHEYGGALVDYRGGYKAVVACPEK